MRVHFEGDDTAPKGGCCATARFDNHFFQKSIKAAYGTREDEEITDIVISRTGITAYFERKKSL